MMITKTIPGIWIRMVVLGMLVICVDQKEALQLKHVCVTKKQTKFPVICAPLFLPLTYISTASQKKISYFGPGKGLYYFIHTE